MPHDSNSSAPSSARTSSKPPATPLTESQYLTRQQADARKAIDRTLDELKRDLLQTADPRAWMQVHPWATLGASVIAGFVATAAVVPSKEQQALRHLARIEEALDRREQPERPSDGEKPGSRMGGFQVLLYRVLQPMILSTLTGFLSGKAAAEPTPGPDPDAEAFSTAAAPTGVDPGI